MQMIQRREVPSPLANKSLALRNIHDLTYRHLFVRHFISSTKSLRYAFITSEGQTITQLGFEQSLTLVIDHKQIFDWKAIFRSAPFANSVQITVSSTSMHVHLTFGDQTSLQLTLIFNLRKKGIVFNEAEQVLKYASTNSDGIKVAHFTHTFEYYYLSFCLDRQMTPTLASVFFRNLLPESRQQILDYFSDKYYLSVRTLESMIESVKECSTQIIIALQHQPANRGMMRFQHRYAYLVDSIQGWFIST